MHRLLSVLLAVFAFHSPSLAAQRQAAPLFVRTAPTVPNLAGLAEDFDGGKAAAAGVLGMVSGLAVGAFIGHRFDRRPCDFCIEFGLVGAFVGTSLGSPYAVHLSNNGRGRLAPAVLASFAIAMGGLGVAAAAHDGRVLLAVPVLQIASAIAIERRTGEQASR